MLRLLLNTFNKWFIVTVVLQYRLIDSYIQDRVSIHYAKFTLKDEINVSKKLKERLTARVCIFTNSSCSLIALLWAYKRAKYLMRVSFSHLFDKHMYTEHESCNHHLCLGPRNTNVVCGFTN